MISLTPKDALLAIDIQNDFLPGGALAVPGGGDVVPVINAYIDLFVQRGLPIYATRDWHPANHCSFREQGGPWPAHCVQGTWGAEFAPSLSLPDSVVIWSKASDPRKEAYSDFEASDLARRLRSQGVERLFIGGLATDYCVLAGVRDALRLGFDVCLLVDAIRAVNVQPDDGRKAMNEMIGLGAQPISLGDIER